MKVDKKSMWTICAMRIRKKLKASFTIEAAIAVGFILCFLSMSISYEIQQMDRILGKIQIQEKEQENWSIEDEIKNYLKIKELLDVIDYVKGESREKDGN